MTDCNYFMFSHVLSTFCARSHLLFRSWCVRCMKMMMGKGSDIKLSNFRSLQNYDKFVMLIDDENTKDV